MWKVNIAGEKDLVSMNNFFGRQHWEFDTNAGTPDEHAEVERLRDNFKAIDFAPSLYLSLSPHLCDVRDETK